MTFALRGIVPVLQTPFRVDGAVDESSFHRLVAAATREGAAGFLVPAVASEASYLTDEERDLLIDAAVGSQLPVIAGCSADTAQVAEGHARRARRLGAAACLASVPDGLRADPVRLTRFFQAIADAAELPLVVQDLQFDGPGLSLDTIERLAGEVPGFAGLKIETVPAGPKYTAVRQRLGNVFLAGGWAVPQLIEALDRGVDAMIPEASMVSVYVRIAGLHGSGRRDDAIREFRALLPVLAFANQELWTSIAFFKRLLVRRGIFRTGALRGPAFPWDEHNERIAEELIGLYLEVEGSM